MEKPQLVAGTRDLAPIESYRRQFIFNTLQDVFSRFGFQPLETPAMERMATLTGKYGDEGDQLLYKIQNSGEKAHEAPEKGLRYDLTVPFARFVVQNQHHLAFPFKRYQIQPVWRAERQQKGRYREFYQCDVDVIGSKSLLYEAELLQIYDQAFAKLGLKVVIRYNHRIALEALAELAGQPERFREITTALDKLDKIGWDGVEKELAKLEVNEVGFHNLKNVITHAHDLEKLAALLPDIETANTAVRELKAVFQWLTDYKFENKVVLDLSLARGLSYYTGCIFEVVADKEAPGQENISLSSSIGGGGRYDNLTGVFGVPNMSGVGISFGADRIYDILLELNRFPEASFPTVKALLLSMDEEALQHNFRALHALRQAGIAADIYPEAAKFRKQMDYASKRAVPFVLIVGESERLANQFTLKNMQSGIQWQGLSLAEVIQHLA